MRAFFERDYHKAAVAHVEAGWVPPSTRVDEFEADLRALCEPIFDRPLKEIYFAKLLMRLFEVGRRFGIELQPQLTLLLKTMLQVEGLGRQLDPDLDLRRTAQPILERWMNEQMGWRAFARRMRDEAPEWARTLPQLPRLLHDTLAGDAARRLEGVLTRIEQAQRYQARVLAAIAIVLALLALAWFLRG